ncbi:MULTISPECIES: ABC transporter permease [Pseudothermotoga]|jgi:tungstate transport system permease protein|uniref:Binding-protein-dependent transport systems inner membrane component n=1 Tax=Pseudothermotoga lettingae (strain ATCC BAA-301 / DSM 14385 / NBRC 107922 / TMO) TaxID=416591 RepID=A8F5H0_PSELT|nr:MULTISPECIES: ABC transporter permease [Pseudothermotoga]ABV33404.1 binding-protein-dependent transport systems inner membrane component [Pseudothermotoga lettingae TMO]MDI3495713.1 tungstate transport system permease protein [Pseudothermotoga sp.]MDK2884425.1 tungstate transport system permease protein [Pseudothermotoga sp.]GLI49682.1 tungstate ABC transporter permease [Pseudothermotoga lettingae TMO]
MNEIAEISLRSIYVNSSAILISTVIAVPLALVVDFFSFKFKKTVVLTFQTLTGVPPVLIGLLVYLLLSRNGPMGNLDLLFTSAAMIFAQVLIAIPIIFSVCYSHFSKVDEKLRIIMKTLGANKFQQMMGILEESFAGVINAILTAFGRVVGEVGAVMIVGGNISGKTRILTTSIVLYTNMGRFESAIISGIVLLCIAFTINWVVIFISNIWRVHDAVRD